MKRLSLVLALLLCVRIAEAQGPPYPYTGVNTWTLSTTPLSLVAGQNIRRAPFSAGACGSWTLLNSALLANNLTTYTDSTLSPSGDGGTFCYAVTAVATNGQESTYDVFDPVPVPPAPPTSNHVTIANHQATFDWVQSAQTVATNSIYYRPGTSGSWTQAWTGAAVTHKVIAIPPSLHGTVQAGITATNANGESGLSNLVQGTLP